jgi:hypothetical protein
MGMVKEKILRPKFQIFQAYLNFLEIFTRN